MKGRQKAECGLVVEMEGFEACVYLLFVSGDGRPAVCMG